MGLTQAVREALKEWLEPGTVSDMRDTLMDMDFPIHQHKNPLASIQTVLKRLIDAGQVEVGTDEHTNKTVYVWAERAAEDRAQSEAAAAVESETK